MNVHSVVIYSHGGIYAIESAIAKMVRRATCGASWRFSVTMPRLPILEELASYGEENLHEQTTTDAVAGSVISARESSSRQAERDPVAQDQGGRPGAGFHPARPERKQGFSARLQGE